MGGAGMGGAGDAVADEITRQDYHSDPRLADVGLSFSSGKLYSGGKPPAENGL